MSIATDASVAAGAGHPRPAGRLHSAAQKNPRSSAIRIGAWRPRVGQWDVEVQ
ncbi:MAG: hypothetical protein U0R27_02215 [Candidatus Nanopelagicales bacterium]